jgi:hypothetical protein
MADNSFRRFTNTRLETPRQLSYVIRVTICYLTSYHSAYKPDDIKPRFCFANPLKSSHVIGMFHCLFIVSEILAARTVSISSLNLFRYIYKVMQRPILYSIYIIFKNSLIIQEQNTKKNHKRVVVLYVIKNHVNLHKF